MKCPLDKNPLIRTLNKVFELENKVQAIPLHWFKWYTTYNDDK